MSATPFSSSTPTRHRGFDPLGRLRRRIVASIAGIVAWISFTLLYLAFWATHFSIFQSVVVVFVSLVILGGVLATAWITFGLAFSHRWSGGWD